MGSLPALYVQPPQDPTQGLERAVSLRNLLQNAPIQHQILQQQAQAGALENQQRQTALKDQQAMTAAMQQWDGKNYDDLPGLVLKQGGSAQAVMGLKSNLLQYKTGLANLTKDQLAAEKTKNDYFAQAIDNVKSLPQEKQAAAFEAAKQDAVQKGHLDPQQAQGLTYQGPQQLDLLEKSLKGHDSVIEQSLKEQQTKEAAAKTEEATSAAAKNRMEVESGGTGAMADSRYRNILMKPAAQRTAEDNAFVKAYEKQKTLVPQMNINLQAQAARGSNAALANVPPHLVAPATAAANKAGEDYAAAKSVSDRMNATMDAAKRGNVISYQIIPEEGTLQITTSQGVHRINRTEIEQYAGGGSLWQRLEGHFGRQLTGKSIPDSVLKDMAEIQKIQAEGARSKYNNSLKTINKTYGANFEPVEMEDMKTPEAAPASAGKLIYARDPQGKLHSAPEGTQLPAGWTVENK